jgi:hypothetical protein
MNIDEILEELGQMVDEAENFIALAKNPHMNPVMLAASQKKGLEILRDRIKALYINMGGEDVWNG